MKKSLISLGVLICLVSLALAEKDGTSGSHLFPFGEGGQIKMLYDSRQRPQAVCLDGKIHLVFNAGGKQGAVGKSKTKPMAVSFDLKTRQLTDIVTLGPGSSDHHDGPVLWADRQERLHVFYGWHHDLGTHLMSGTPRSIGTRPGDWITAPAPAPKMSYPWMSRVYDNKQLVFYRTDGHYSSWTYRITSDDGQTWQGPETDVLDLDIKGGMDTDWSIYTAKAVSQDGTVLHVGFIAYDDYKRPRSPEEIANGKLDKRRQQNPLYDNRKVSYKYNLYYVKVDLRTHRVMNDKGETLKTPIDLSTANRKCMIWDTQWRGGGIVPSMLVEENDQVSFLHNLSDTQHETSLAYHYVRLENGAWRQSRITDSNHEWNSGTLAKEADGSLHAYVITGEGYLDSDGYMDKHGGGNIEEWVSRDLGNTWKKARDLTPDPATYPGWKYNNVQPVTSSDGRNVDGMLLFYGWKDKEVPEAKAFLWQDESAADGADALTPGSFNLGLN